ncbi:phospho-acceptor domain-containing protein [Haloactinopolyspora alba]|uniref:histidine kinase n=1 Tax=Haloactinopolyspora alba TaxID=648780 RepID=A0A2P8DK22_9ACTN|nr:HAMP domain-containing sensor histidine kinase [Haloactinopolyspora alba]PSK97575.1 phospho-acceptor domain-containing protein [Haloactinopolyspora alba]
MRPRQISTVAVLAAGLLVAGVIAASAGLPTGDTVVLVSVTALASGAAVLAGAMVLRGFRGRAVRTQALVVALSSLLVTVSGIVTAAQAMFISRHDLVALFVVVSVAAAVAVGAALQLGDDVGAGTRQVGELARTLVDERGAAGGPGADTDAAADAGAPADDAVADGPRAPVTGPGELATLARELAQVSADLDESRRRERALESSRRELIAWVSHDLRSPLATIRAMAEALDDDIADDAATVNRYQRQIRDDAERLTALVDDLFELSRINSGTLRLDREMAGLNDVVADALAGAGSHASVKGVELVEKLGRLPAVEVSAREFTRALNNLLDNAIRHTPQGGRVTVRSRADDDGAVLDVVDQCGGIPEPDLTRVFDVAFRGDAARGRDAAGGGLGLAIARGLVEAHAGSVDVANTGGGCCFTIRLPSR